MSHTQPDPASTPAATPAGLTDGTVATPPLPVAYSPPAIIFRARLEATAAFCGDPPNGKSFGVCDSWGTLNS